MSLYSHIFCYQYKKGDFWLPAIILFILPLEIYFKQQLILVTIFLLQTNFYSIIQRNKKVVKLAVISGYSLGKLIMNLNVLNLVCFNFWYILRIILLIVIGKEFLIVSTIFGDFISFNLIILSGSILGNKLSFFFINEKSIFLKMCMALLFSVALLLIILVIKIYLTNIFAGLTVLLLTILILFFDLKNTSYYNLIQ